MRRAGEAGASLVEYALLLALLILVAVMGLRFLGQGTSNSIDENTSTIQNAKTTVP
jgi:Flp pilus assembly pilin Flp